MNILNSMARYDMYKHTQNTQGVQEREIWIDWLRGFAISIIVIGHVLIGLYSSSEETINPIGRFVILFSYSINIPLLFFVSGAVCRDERKKPTVFLRLLGLWTVWPYFLWSFILVIVQHYFPFGVNRIFSFDALQNCYYKPISIFWFLYAYALIKVVSYVSFLCLSSRNALISLFALSISTFLFSMHTDNIGIIYSTSIGLFFFAIGKTYRVHQNQISSYLNKMGKRIVIRTASGFSFITLILMNYYNWQLPEEQLFPIYVFQYSIFLTGLLGIVVCSHLAFYLSHQKYNTLFESLGRYTMAIYLLHVFVVGGARHVLHIFVSNIFLLDFIVLLFLGIVLPMFCQIFLDRINLNILFGIPKIAGSKTKKC